MQGTILIIWYSLSMSKNRKSTKPFAIALALFFLLCFVTGVIFYHVIEGMALVDAVYLTAMTLTTVGYGDFVPATVEGKLFTSVYAFLGVVTFLSFAGLVFQSAINRYKEK